MVYFNIFRFSRRRLFIFLSTGVLFAIGIWLLNNFFSYPHFWDRFYTENDIDTSFCERTFMDKIVRQPINTFSNFVYWMTAIILLRRGWKDQSKRKKYNIICANPSYSIAYGFILLYTFIASTIFHASLIHFASRLDFSAVYSMVLFPLMYFTHRVWLLRIRLPSNAKHPRSMRILIIGFTLMYLFFTFCMPIGWDDYVVLVLIFLVVLFGIIMEREDPGRTNTRYLMACIAFILVAVICFALDQYKIFCYPDNFLQMHSLWHLFSGTSAFYFYMYIRSEKNMI